MIGVPPIHIHSRRSITTSTRSKLFCVMSLSGGMLEKVCHRLQDLPRKRVIRYGAGQRHRSDESTESQDRSRSRCTLIFAWQQLNNQLKICLDLIRGKRTSSLVAASDFRGQCAEDAASTWIFATILAGAAFSYHSLAVG